jgi:hypothetical protein
MNAFGTPSDGRASKAVHVIEITSFVRTAAEAANYVLGFTLHLFLHESSRFYAFHQKLQAKFYFYILRIFVVLNLHHRISMVDTEKVRGTGHWNRREVSVTGCARQDLPQVPIGVQ